MTSASVPASEAPPLRDAHERRIPAPVFWELVAVVVPLVDVIIAIPGAAGDARRTIRRARRGFG